MLSIPTVYFLRFTTQHSWVFSDIQKENREQRTQWGGGSTFGSGIPLQVGGSRPEIFEKIKKYYGTFGPIFPLFSAFLPIFRHFLIKIAKKFCASRFHWLALTAVAVLLVKNLSKAFDCLLHDLLIAKLHAYGFDYFALKLIYSYLTGRKQRVCVNASFSEWATIENGVPQGSILGPELYNYNSNDLFLFVMLDIANYADDNSPFTVAPTIPKVISNLEAEAQNLLSWNQYNGMKANPDKFHLLLSEIDESQKLLGVVIDNKLSFKNHVTSLCTKASQKLHALSRVSNYMDLKQRKIIMHSFILSQFGYCPLVWMFHSRQLNNRINRIHDRSLKIVYKEFTSSFDTLLAKDKSSTIHERNIQTLGIELYKVAYGISPGIMRLILPTKLGILYPWNDIFQTFNVRTVSWGTETLSHLGPKIWNLIPLELKKLRSLSKFKKSIRLWKPEKCPCRMCKTYIQGVGFVNVV